MAKIRLDLLVMEPQEVRHVRESGKKEVADFGRLINARKLNPKDEIPD